MEGQIDAAFDRLRSAGGKASHGKVSYYLLKHTVTVAGIDGRTVTQPSLHFKSANVILRALGGIAGEADWSELVRLLMVDALYTRLEIMMRAAGGVPDDEESVHLLRHWQQRLQ